MTLRCALILSVCLIFTRPFLAYPQSSQKIWTQQAQAGSEEVDVYTQADFDSEVITIIKPGKFYWISEKPEGPFYKIRIAPNKIGYVPDTELEIKGRGAFQTKSFEEDSSDESTAQKKQKMKKSKKPTFDDDGDDEESENAGKNHLLSFNLINYHEDTLGGIQVGDLWAVNYKNLAWGASEADYGMGGLSWDIMAAFDAPEYYTKKTGFDASGTILWGGVQFQNYSGVTTYNQLRYGLGPFLKYSQFNVQTSLKKYSLQDATIGVTLEAAFQFIWTSVGIDLGLRYYWDKTPYGVVSAGVLF